MAKKRVILDTNVILECFRINVWNELTQRCQVETVEACITESLSGDRYRKGFIAADPVILRTGCHRVHEVSQRDVDILDLTYPEMGRLDDGERHLFAWLLAKKIQLSEFTVLSTADKGAIVRANDHPGWLDWIQSLQEVLKEAKVPRAKIEAVGYQHTAGFLQKVRTDVRNGVIP